MTADERCKLKCSRELVATSPLSETLSHFSTILFPFFVLQERCDEPNSFKMIRTKAELVDVTAETLYDVLHDPGYRSVWDKHVTDIKEIGHIDPNNSISYFTSEYLHQNFIIF